MSLLSLIQDATDIIGMPRPSAVVNSTDPTVRQLLSTCKAVGKDLLTEYQWEGLVREATFATAAAEDQGTILSKASDFLRFIPDTFWNRTSNRQVYLVDASEWQQVKGSIVTTIHDTARIRGGNILILPAPAAGETMAFEYITKNWITDQNGANPADSFTADTDLPLLDEEVLKLGTVWRFLDAKGLDYSEHFRRYETRLAKLKMQNGLKPVLTIGGRKRNMGILIPESWPIT